MDMLPLLMTFGELDHERRRPMEGDELAVAREDHELIRFERDALRNANEALERELAAARAALDAVAKWRTRHQGALDCIGATRGASVELDELYGKHDAAFRAARAEKGE